MRILYRGSTGVPRESGEVRNRGVFLLQAIRAVGRGRRIRGVARGGGGGDMVNGPAPG